VRILVAGATGYIGSRLVPELLGRGHQVVAASSSRPDPARFSWGDAVTWVRMDARKPGQVRTASDDVQAVAYLVHGLDSPGFARSDAQAAGVVRRVSRERGIGRVVYLSGLVPDVARDRLSPHLASRLQVEEILADAAPSTLTLRAGVVLGAGSTSFEIIRQTAAVALVHAVPPWMHARVQPISVLDTVRLLADALERPSVKGHLDVGGPDVLSYGDLLRRYCTLAGLHRVQIAAPGSSPAVAASLAPLLCAAPWRTVSSLVRSLGHDMICRPDSVSSLEALSPHGPDLLSVDEAVQRALQPSADPHAATTYGGDPHGLASSDPAWVQSSRWRRAVPTLPLGMDGVLSGLGHVAEHRLRGLAGSVISRARP
jgi:uncharacterized protein YbjT (DUF2867 family)